MYYDPKTNRPCRSHVSLVCGAPASGKTTYVKQHYEPGDFVFDMDVLRQALGAPEKTADCFQNLLLAVRRVIYQHIACNSITAKNVWVISGLPDKSQREETAKFLKAKIIFMETSKEECLRRAMNDPERIDKEKQIKIIEGYFKALS